MEMPDVTLVQKLVGAVAAAATTIGSALVSFDVLTVAQAGAVVAPIVALGGVYVAADAVIRNGRSKIAAAKVADKPYDSVVGR